MENRRLPNELLAEIAHAMPAGISSLVKESNFMKRMDPLSAFLLPRIRKSLKKRTLFWQNMALQQRKRALEWKELTQAYRLLSSDMKTQQGLPSFDQAKEDEFDRRFAALNQQEKERNKQDEMLSREVATFESAWKSSKRFALELIGEKEKANGDGNIQQNSIVNSSRKRKKPTGGNGEEEESAVCSKKAKMV